MRNLAHGARLSSGDRMLSPQQLARVIDGDKEAADSSIIYLRKGPQWIQLDFGKRQELFAVALWHAHNMPKVYHDVILQVSDDPEFRKGVTTLFNNDRNNSAGFRPGLDREYWETHEGKLFNARGAKARYLRCYSNGSTESALNEYTEIEVYGREAR